MKITSAIAATALVVCSAVQSASAQVTTGTAINTKPDNAAVATPVLTYESPLAGFVPLQESTLSPALNWRTANLAVGSYDSMAATVEDTPAAQPEPASKSPPAAASSPAVAPQQTMPKPMTGGAHMHGSHMPGSSMSMPMPAHTSPPADTKKGSK